MRLSLRSRSCFARFGFLRGDDFAGAAFGLDLGASRSAKSMRGYGKFASKFTVTKNFDATGRAIGKAGPAQCGLINACAVFELIEGVEIHRDVTCCMSRIIEAALGNTTNEWHLATFKANADGTARARGLAFATATAGFAMAAGFALAEPLTAMLGAGTRFKIV